MRTLRSGLTGLALTFMSALCLVLITATPSHAVEFSGGFKNGGGWGYIHLLSVSDQIRVDYEVQDSQIGDHPWGAAVYVNFYDSNWNWVDYRTCKAHRNISPGYYHDCGVSYITREKTARISYAVVDFCLWHKDRDQPSNCEGKGTAPAPFY